MTKCTLIKKLEKIRDRENRDEITNHAEADDLLLEFINDEEVAEVYNSITMWDAQ